MERRRLRVRRVRRGAGLGNAALLAWRAVRHLPDEPYNKELKLTRSARGDGGARPSQLNSVFSGQQGTDGGRMP
jgi:hypothetical protein